MLAAPARGLARSAGMKAAVRDLEAAIASTGGVLICGEAGTGREAIARAIHRAARMGEVGQVEELLRLSADGMDGGAPFVVVDCAAMSDLELMVFGSSAPGSGHGDLDHITPQSSLYQALGGTLFLRSVQDMPGRVQTRLARVLRDGEARVDSGNGSRDITQVRLRAIASIEPSGDGDDGHMVPELQKRLAAHRIEIPPLRQRREDIPDLVRVILGDICRSLQIPVKTVSTQAVSLLCALPWRGNFKEMRSVLRALVLKSPGRLIRLSDVLANIRLDGGGGLTFMGGGTLKEARERFEREYVAAVLEQHHGRMAEAARALGIQRTNLYRKVKQLAVRRKTVRRS